jgi:dihydrofolate reductase
MVLTGIVCVADDMGIGLNNKCLFRIPEDRKFFYDIITNKTIVVGRKTYESLPKTLLTRPKYIHILSSQNPLPENYINTDEEIIVIGGGKVYESLSQYIKEWYITHVHAIAECDSYFKVNLNNFNKIILYENNHNNIDYEIVKYC